ncbi:hypothetical protein [Mesorhizobium sp. M0491]|uniref:hypothetical protein n=1 Tax=Mesorhizobium sp. M0491 TaxID=2956950 RepID=UPI00333C7B1B
MRLFDEIEETALALGGTLAMSAGPSYELRQPHQIVAAAVNAVPARIVNATVPDVVHDTVRDLVRAREAAADDLRRKRQQLLSFLLRHGRIYENGAHWTLAHRHWLARQSFEHTEQQIVFQEKIDAIEDAAQRLHRLDDQLRAVVPTWSMARVVEAYQAMRGASFLVAVIFAAEIGDVPCQAGEPSCLQP